MDELDRALQAKAWGDRVQWFLQSEEVQHALLAVEIKATALWKKSQDPILRERCWLQIQAIEDLKENGS